MSTDKLIGQMLMLSDGLSTNVFSSYYSKMIGKETLDKYMRIERVAKKYLARNIFNPSENRLIIFCNAYKSVWKDIFEVNASLDFPFSTNMRGEIMERLSLFENWVGEVDYV